LFGLYRPLSVWSGIATIAAFVWELSLGIRLVAKVFKPSHITAGLAVNTASGRHVAQPSRSLKCLAKVHV
jgi:hypothetical protein